MNFWSIERNCSYNLINFFYAKVIFAKFFIIISLIFLILTQKGFSDDKFTYLDCEYLYKNSLHKFNLSIGADKDSIKQNSLLDLSSKYAIIYYTFCKNNIELDPSAEVNQILGGKEADDFYKKKNVKAIPEVDSYETTYFEFPGDFTTNLKGSRKFLQVSVGVSTQYDEKVMEVVDSHQLALRTEILSTISDFTEEDISGSDGKKKLIDRLMVVLNKKLESLDEFPGIEDVYFTSFIIQ